jgi:hypothetical protein
MYRWHSERSLMLRRWKQEMALHGYDWRNPPDPKCDRNACHCAAGIGSMRKVIPLGCGKPRCGLCHPWKKWPLHNRSEKKRAAILDSLEI